MRSRVIKILLPRLATLSLACALDPAGLVLGQDIALSTAPGGMAIIGLTPYRGGFGNVNGLGVGAPGAGINMNNSGVTGGAFYWSPISLTVTGGTAVVRAYIYTDFSHPATLILSACSSGPCSSYSSYTSISKIAGSPTTIIAPPGAAANTAVTIGIGLFVASTNGGGAFSGTDVAVIRFNVYDTTGTSLITGHNLRLNNPFETVQTAVQLLLSTASGGLPVSPASDFSMNYGNVNGQGIGAPAPGLTIVPAAGGVTYSTPYQMQPSFSSLTSTTGSVSAYVSSGFAHPSSLILQDSASAGGPYASISTLGGSPTPITASAASGSTITRYLGLFVSNANGPGAFPGTSGASGADSAVLTYTLTVP